MDVKKRSEAEALCDDEVLAAEKEKDKPVSFWRSAGGGLFYGLCGYLFGGAALPFGAHPFGIALLCASDRKVFYIYAGLCLGAWSHRHRAAWLVAYSSLLLLRLLVRVLLDTSEEKKGKGAWLEQVPDFPLLFSEHISLRAASAAVGGFGIGLYRLIEGDFLYYDLYGTILETLSAPVAVLLLSGLYRNGRSKATPFARMSLVCFSALLCFSLGELTVYGISASVFCGLFSALFLTRRQGTLTGMAAGTVCGLVSAPMLAPAYAFGALGFGLLHGVSLPLRVSASFLAALAWCSYAKGMGVLQGILPALLSVALLFPVIEKLFFSAPKQAEQREGDAAQSQDTEKASCSALPHGEEEILRLREVNRRIRSLGEGFASLSQVVEQMSRQATLPTESDLRQVCEGSFASSCTSCPQRVECWEQEFTRTEREIDTLSVALRERGEVSHGDAAPTMTLRCSRLPDILEEINGRAAEYRRQTLLCDRTEIFAQDYRAFSQLVEGVMGGEEQYTRDEALSETLGAALSRELPEVCGVAVLEGERRRVLVKLQEPTRSPELQERIRQRIGEHCPFSVDEGEWVEEGTLLYTQCQNLRVSSALRTVCARGEAEYCGDTAGLFTSDRGRVFGLISDGMGAGQEAALTSGIVSLFLRKMLTAGNSCDTALRMLNGFLRNRGSGSLHECSATVDLMELDLMEGRAHFYKSGAAPTYVFREESLFKLRSRTVPMGILKDVDVRRINFEISPGDVIVMVSDGVTQLKEECPWLFDLLRSQGREGGRELSPDRLADLVVKYAKEEGSADDLSVLVIKIEKNG